MKLLDSLMMVGCNTATGLRKLQTSSHLIVDTSQDINDVPYGDYFSVEGRWDVEKGGNNLKFGCILKVYIYVAFSKKTMWRGKIVQSTEEECREAYAIWIDLAHAVLKQRNLEKEEVLLEKQANTQNYEDLKASNARISQIMPDMKDVQQLITNPQDNLSEASTGSLLRDTLTKICASLRYQNVPSLLTAIVIALNLLMQISILVLLSRPQQIHVIPQADYTSSMHEMTGNRAEALVLLNKQMKYLNEEMHLVETLLNKMQHEHALLKEK